VRIGDRAFGVVAESGYGKTSIAARLVLHGAGFVTDDVLALSDDDGQALAHPGPAIIALRPAERDALPPSERRKLGRVLGRSGKTYVAVTRETAPCPLGGLYFLDPRSDAGEPAFEPGVEPRRLLASTFIAGIESQHRLISLLDLTARLEATVPIWRVAINHHHGAAPVSEAIWHHASGTASVG
jgi:hypothetical protein